MHDRPASGRDWTWWPTDWHGEATLNTDRVEHWIITPRELHRRLESGELLVLVDVRERWETALAVIPGSRLIPMNELGYRAEDELDPEDEIVLVCHHGVRSLEAARLLWDQGFEQVKSLAGGIDRWAVEVEPSLPRY